MKNSRDLEEQVKILQAMIDNIPFDAWYKDTEGRYLAFNKSFEKYAGKSAEELLFKTDFEIYPKTEAESYAKSDRITAEKKRTMSHEAWISEKLFKEEGKTPIFDESGTLLGVVGFSRDMTARKMADEKIYSLSFCDQLTGVYNRRYYEDEIKRINKTANLPIALIMADVNGLKHTNDTYGHYAGDLLLRTVGKALKKGCKEKGTLARIGGDEFVLLLPNTDETEVEKIV